VDGERAGGVAIWGERALVSGRGTIEGYPNKLNLCCASHPRISEQCDLTVEGPVAGGSRAMTKFSEASTHTGSKRETGNEIASHQAVDRYRRS
jgi:hypothetical protein